MLIRWLQVSLLTYTDDVILVSVVVVVTAASGDPTLTINCKVASIRVFWVHQRVADSCIWSLKQPRLINWLWRCARIHENVQANGVEDSAPWLLNLSATCKVYCRDWSAWTILPAATMKQKLQIKLAISSTHNFWPPGQLVSIRWPCKTRHLAQ